MDSQKLDTAPELAAFMRVSVATIYSRAKQRLIPCYRVGDRLLFNRAEVLAAIRQPATESEDFEIPKSAVAPGRGR
jgi:excisionase family DNA binding protein